LCVGGLLMYDQALFDRIMARCVETPGPLDTPCMVWQSTNTSDGYGSVRYWGGMRRVHRAIYIATYGLIPKGMVVMHLCDVRKCCNVSHLQLGTHTDNMQDAISKGRRAKQWKMMPLSQADEIRRVRSESGFSYRKLAALFGVDRETVRRVVIGQSRNPFRPLQTGGN
jgi:hypothetical protein